MSSGESADRTPNVAEALRQGIEHHRAGRHQDAERLYRAILQAQPTHPDANHNLGMLALQAGKPGHGLPHLKTALERDPSRGQFWLSYAEGLLAAGRAPDALGIINQAIGKGLGTPGAEELRERAKKASEHRAPVSGEGRSGDDHGDDPGGDPEIGARHARRLKPSARLRQESVTAEDPSQNEIDDLVGMFNQGRLAEVEDRARRLTERWPIHLIG